MSGDWRDRLRTLLDRLAGARTPTSSEIPARQSSGTGSQAILHARHSQPASISINLGIDFGTSFTKICYRDVGSEGSGVIAAGSKFKNGLIPSIVAIGSGDRLHLHDEIALGTHLF